MRGIDNSTYYSLVPSDKSAYWETTGCGNNLQCDNPYVRGFILDSLEYWIDEINKVKLESVCSIIVIVKLLLVGGCIGF